MMRTPESKIKEAILHPEEEIRLHAVCYFSEARCEDESIMPLVIQAVEKYGQEATSDIVDAMHDLPQTEATVDWLINQLRRDYDMSNVEQENYCFRLAWALRNAPQPIFTKRFNDIITARAFPEPLRQSLRERLDTFTWNWERGWTAIKYFAQDTQLRGFSHGSYDWVRLIAASLAGHRQQAEKVLALLAGQYGDEDPCLMCWLRAWIIELAGAMRLTEAVPLLMDMLNSNHSCSASGALRQIDGDAVLRGIDARWRHTGVKLRRIMADLLTHLRGDHCIELALSFFKRERDQETKLTLAEALLENYYEDALDLASSLAEEVGERKCRRREVDLRYRMVMNSMIMGRTFPQFDKWRKSALRNNWGSLGWPPSRIANSYKPEPFGPKWSEN